MSRSTSRSTRGFDQLPPQFRVDNRKSMLDREPWERPPMIFYGVAFPRSLVTDWTVKKGLYKRPDKDTNYSVHLTQYSSARRQLEDMVSCNRRYREVLLDFPVHDTYNEMMVFYSNYARPHDKFPEEHEKAVVDLLKRELGLTEEQARPRWYFSRTA